MADCLFLFTQILSRSCVPSLVLHGANNLKHCIVDQCHLVEGQTCLISCIVD